LKLSGLLKLKGCITSGKNKSEYRLTSYFDKLFCELNLGVWLSIRLLISNTFEVLSPTTKGKFPFHLSIACFCNNSGDIANSRLVRYSIKEKRESFSDINQHESIFNRLARKNNQAF
jgi:hypothetical protein